MFSPQILEQISREIKKDPDMLAIVEGKKDKEALGFFGFIKLVDISGKTLEDVVEKVFSFQPSQVVILTDFDREGENIASLLHNILSHHKIKTNQIIRNKFRSLKIHEIEDLNSFTKLMEDDYNGKIGSIYGKIFNRSRILGRRNCRKARCNRGNIWADRRIVGARS